MVAVRKYYPGKAPPSLPGFTTVLIHTSKDTLGGPLSPYHLKNEYGQFLENIWQFSKIYTGVEARRNAKSRFQPLEIIWDHPGETHVNEGEPNEAYWAWRKKGMNNFYPVRWPNGFHGAKKCLCAIVTEKWLQDPENTDPCEPGPFVRLDYIEARKKIYCAEYARLTQDHPEFLKLKGMLRSGKSLLITEVDGPEPGVILSETLVRFHLEDKSRPFGDGMVIGSLLVGGEKWMQM